MLKTREQQYLTFHKNIARRLGTFHKSVRMVRSLHLGLGWSRDRIRVLAIDKVKRKVKAIKLKEWQGVLDICRYAAKFRATIQGDIDRSQFNN